MTFGFSLYAIPLQVTLVVYFKRVLGRLRGLMSLKVSISFAKIETAK